MKNPFLIFFVFIFTAFLSATDIDNFHESEFLHDVNMRLNTQENWIEIRNNYSNCALEIPSLNVNVKKITFNICTFMNGVGLEIDQKILANALRNLGHDVNCIDLKQRKKPPKADINIFFEQFNQQWLFTANQNWFVPNPEWYYHGEEALGQIDLILCRTREVERIFKKYSKDIYYLGFTSVDCFQPGINKDFHSIFHLAGKSVQKGTGSVISVWRNNPQFPILNLLKKNRTVKLDQPNYNLIAGRLEENDLRNYQNTCGIHLCPSETEGFGHYISEAMSTGAVVVTTNAPPMNEFITDPRCLVKYERTKNQNFAINYYVDPKDLEKIINNLLKLSNKKLNSIGQKNRKAFLQNQKMFHHRLKLLLESELVDKKKTNPITN
ncbi:MAG: glycosyltransferase [Parachlamydiaceae bacterium]|nr:glycosyltransferase [Parachlamydiaceae bacterium]